MVSLYGYYSGSATAKDILSLWPYTEFLMNLFTD